MSETETKTRENYRIRGKRVWALARAGYLAGESARAVAERLGLTEYAIRKRISREGWSKRALAEAEEAGVPDPPPDTGWCAASLVAAAVPEAPETPDGEGPAPREAARAALEAAGRMMREGRMTAAAEAARVADVMARAAARLGDGAAADMGPTEAEFEAVRRKVLGLPPPSGEE